MCFDLIAKEREKHSLDLLLQGASRSQIYVAKGLAAVLYAFAAALLFNLVTVAGYLIKGHIPLLSDMLCEMGALWWMLAIYALLALVSSILFYQGKWSLVAVIITWVLMRPSFIAVLIFKPLENILNLTKTDLWRALSFLPEYSFRLILDPLRAVPDGVSISPWWGYVILTGYVVILTIGGWLIFRRQDEPAIYLSKAKIPPWNRPNASHPC